MSKLSELVGKPTRIKLGSIELDIKPLSLEDLELFNGDDDSNAGAMKTAKAMINKVLKDSVPDVTEEELKSISLEYMEELMDHIMKINKLDNNKLSKLNHVNRVKE